MHARWAVAVIAVLLLALLPPAGGLTEQERAGGWSGALPKGIRPGIAPIVELRNATAQQPVNLTGAFWSFTVSLYDEPPSGIANVTLTLEVYRWAMLGEERVLLYLDGPVPGFFVDINSTTPNMTAVASYSGALPGKASPWVVQLTLLLPYNAVIGYYRVRTQVTFDTGHHDDRVARSRGYFEDATWDSLVSAARKDGDLTKVGAGVDGILPEAGFTVGPKNFKYISLPNRVPDLGNFTTPTIRPGRSGTYNFTVTNRYNEEMTGVKLEVEVYMWATLESSRPIGRLGGPAPQFKDARATNVTRDLGTIGAHASVPATFDISTKEDTPKGTYFVKHNLTFSHNGTVYTMSSRGHFTSAQWEGFAYNNLYYQLSVSGIVPDSSFNVKDPVPMWPLGVLVALCALFGALAVVFYLAEEHGPEYPRLKKALQYWTGKYEQRRRLLQQRLDELRREVDVADEDDER